MKWMKKSTSQKKKGIGEDNYGFFLKFKVFSVPSVAWNCSIVPQQNVIISSLNLFAGSNIICMCIYDKYEIRNKILFI